MRTKTILAILINCLFTLSVHSQQQTETLTLNDAIFMAAKNSPDALSAKHTFLGAYWQFRSFRAEMLPSVSLSAALPSLNRSLYLEENDGKKYFIESNNMSNDASVSLNQLIPFTGGTISASSSLNRVDIFGDSSYYSYGASPIGFSISQPLKRYNPLKWSMEIEPKKYEQAKKKYLESMEDIASKAISSFFGLASSNLNLSISEINLSNADTLYKIGKGRFKIGTIAEDELLSLELALINANIELKRSLLEHTQKQAEFINYLGLPENTAVNLILPDSVPSIPLNMDSVLLLAYENNPGVLDRELALISSEQSFTQAKAESGFNANLTASYSLANVSGELRNAYSGRNTGQNIGFSISVPILDWGKREGQVKMAQSNLQLAKANAEQDDLQFRQQIYNLVMQFNIQPELFEAAMKSDKIAQLRYDISKQRYMVGKISTLELNDALKNKDASKRNYLSSIHEYWTKYYEIRKLTLYDFIEDKNLSADFDALVR